MKDRFFRARIIGAGIVLALGSCKTVDLAPLAKGVESGNPFHLQSPPFAGSDTLGMLVSATNPGKLDATYNSVDSDSYRNPAYTKKFDIGSQPYTPPDITTGKKISADLAFAQLSDILKAKGMTNTGKPGSGNGATGQPGQASGGQAGGGQAAGGQAGGGQASGGQAAGGQAGGGQASGGQAGGGQAGGTQSQCQSKNRTDTGLDFCIFSNLVVKATGLKAVFYNPDTLQDMINGTALNDFANKLLSPDGKNWIMHRILVVDTLQYTFTSSSSLGVGLKDSLAAWLPTFSVGYDGNRTYTLNSKTPLTIGYKLWRPALGFGAASVGRAQVRGDVLGLGDKQIRKMLEAK